MEEGYTNFTLRMKEKDRDEWKDAVEYSDQFSSLSQLVRYSVNQEIRRIEDRQEGEMTKEEKEILSKIEHEGSRTRDLLKEIQEKLDELEEASLSISEAKVLEKEQTATILENIENE
ncbi:hypothetical protein PNQ29_00665 [Halobacterium salinarum]|uniref:hypothetical protein n=1 Tax=Halobacterium salinarum TaxID=2242 RepID=UPI002552F1B8|nr:hypothetical protein [Halobacterium salinarum]MDL0118272.1 hypothetical protein [Halobacterium salinarum]